MLDGRSRFWLNTFKGRSGDRFEFLRSRFLSYYKDNSKTVENPHRMREREFGFLLFRDKVMIRHKAFQDLGGLIDAVLSLIPSDVYYSTAYYLKPDVEMDKKGWIGSDIVFDIDADHVETPCKKSHDMWICQGCGMIGTGSKPSKCESCGGNKVEEKSWLCDSCLVAAREEVLKLVEFLVEDFGILSEEMYLFFSGHRGYHLHISSEKMIKLGEAERKEMVDYVIALGLDPSHQGLYQNFLGKRQSIVVGPETTDPGWRGRLARGVYQILTESDESQLAGLGFSPGAAKDILRDREKIQKQWSRSMLWSSFLDRWKINDEAWRNIMERVLDLVALPAKVDTVVTTDIHRLIRMPGTLNGKTGFKAVTVKLDQLEEFDPFYDPVVLTGTAQVDVKYSPQMRIRDQTLGPYKNERVELPMAAAVLLVAKGLASPA